MAANLTYEIFTGRLVGYANKAFFCIDALSGGGGGSTKDMGSSSTNNPYYTGLKSKFKSSNPHHIHGGPIPPGRYKIARPSKHVRLGLSAQLIPDSSNSMMGRSGFFIHGRGVHGSDGCIVPLSGFQDLMNALEAEAAMNVDDKESSTSIAGVLFVIEEEEGRFA
jgi:hypothetical protein